MTNLTNAPHISIAVSILKIEEGYRARPYLCPTGYITIGYGNKLSNNKNITPEDLEFYLPEPVALSWLQDTVTQLERALIGYDWYQVCNSERKAILISMAYQLGMHGLLQFKHFLASLVAQQWKDASKHGLDSLWASQAPSKAQKHMSIIEHGFIGEVY
jgi:lysozyme